MWNARKVKIQAINSKNAMINNITPLFGDQHKEPQFPAQTAIDNLVKLFASSPLRLEYQRLLRIRLQSPEAIVALVLL
jgi:hypothetical protein